ncbi:MAG: photosystem I reaction center subunit IV, partial [Gammaproteobacteria bacterium]|nr:photosystem I reaction center subunit IV [Gammaproteobacteria bacterium]
YHLNAITDNGQGELFIAAESGYVYRSGDDGASWETLKPPYDGSFFDIVAYGDNIIVTGLRGHVFISRDRGDTWKPLPTGIQTALTAITRLQNNQLVIVGHAGVVLLVDGSMNTTSLYRLSSRSATSDAAEISANQLMLVGEHGASVLNLCDAFTEVLSEGCK